MDVKFYVDILCRHTPEIKQMLGNRWRFQQDNDPKRTSRLAKAFHSEEYVRCYGLAIQQS